MIRKKNKILKILFFIGLFVVLSVIAASLYVYTHKEEIKLFCLQQINQSLKTEISTQAIEVTFIRTFPMAAVVFREVCALVPPDAPSANDTLFSAKNIFLEFNLLDIYRGNYRVRNLIIEDATIVMTVFENGSNNYDIWKEKESNSAPDELFNFSLQKVQLRNVDYTYLNKATKQYYHTQIKNGQAKGDFSSKQQHFTLKGDMFVYVIKLDGIPIIENSPLKSDIDLIHFSDEQRIEIAKGGLKLQRIHLRTKGLLSYDENSQSANLSILGEKIPLKTFVSILPSSTSDYLSSFSLHGEMNMSILIKGNFSSLKLPNIDADFDLQQAKISDKKSKQQLENVSLSGKYTNGSRCHARTSELTLNKFGFNVDGGRFEGKLHVQNFDNPKIDLQTDANLNLKTLLPFIPSADLKDISGETILNLNLKGYISDFKNINTSAFDHLNMSGKASITNFFVETNWLPLPIKEASLTFDFNRKDVNISHAKGLIGQTSFALSGKILNLLPVIFQEGQNLGIKGNVDLGDFRSEEWTFNTKEKETTDSSSFLLPKNLTLDLSTTIRNFYFEKCHAKKSKFRLLLTPSGLTFKDVNMTIWDGNLRGEVAFTPLHNQHTKVSGDIAVRKVQVDQFFSTFNNFGQETVIDKNLQGAISSKFHFAFQLLPSGDPDWRSLSLAANSLIENGRLANIGMLQKLSYFVDEAALNDIAFNSFESNITIANNKILVEKMDVKSNALNFVFSGSHTFDNEINYHIILKFSELYSKKKKQRMLKEQQEFGAFSEDEKNCLFAFLKVTGTIDNPIFAYDFSSNRTMFKENLAKDKKIIVNALKKDLGVNPEKERKQKEEWKNQERGNYIIEWEEDEPVSEDSLSNERPDIDSDFIIEWEE